MKGSLWQFNNLWAVFNDFSLALLREPLGCGQGSSWAVLREPAAVSGGYRRSRPAPNEELKQRAEGAEPYGVGRRRVNELTGPPLIHDLLQRHRICPSVFDESCTEPAIRDAEGASPFGDGPGLATELYENASSPVVGLRHRRFPSAIPGTVVAVIIDPAKRVVRSRSGAYILVELLKIIPSLADANSSAAVSSVSS